jgi:SAM-dependent methyltransferase
MGAFFGELYLRSTLPFLREAVTALEASFLRARLPGGPTLDLGCGHGRHLRELGSEVLGLDFDLGSLVEAVAFAPVARGDMRALPFRDAVFAAGYAWYNTIATFPREVTVGILRELTRCIRPGGTVIVQGSNPARAREKPTASWAGKLPDGSSLLEETVWSEARGQDEISRQLTLPDGRVMAASFFIRYYDLDEWRALLSEAGLTAVWSCGDVDGSPIGSHSNDIIVGAQKRG